MWVEFVVGSLLCFERFFSRYSGFPLSSKTNIFKFQFDPGMHGHFKRVLVNFWCSVGKQITLHFSRQQKPFNGISRHFKITLYLLVCGYGFLSSTMSSSTSDVCVSSAFYLLWSSSDQLNTAVFFILGLLSPYQITKKCIII